MTARLSVNINDETADALRSLAAKQGTSVTEQVRRAVGVYGYMREQQDGGAQIRLADDSTYTYVKII